jgi:hypothetical protein
VTVDESSETMARKDKGWSLEMDYCTKCRALINTPATNGPHARLSVYGELTMYSNYSTTTYECADCHAKFERRETMMPRGRVTWSLIGLDPSIAAIVDPEPFYPAD